MSEVGKVETREGTIIWFSNDKHIGVIYSDGPNGPERFFLAERFVVAGPRPTVDARVRFKKSPIPPKREGNLWCALSIEVLPDAAPTTATGVSQ
jgi:hypothetical protein